MSARFIVGDVFDGLASLPDHSVDCVVTSPPFLALRSYLPPDHPDKAKEIGAEPTPAAFLDTLLELTAELRRVVAPHGSIFVELGDTYSGSGGAGGDYADGGLRDGQQAFSGSASRVTDPRHKGRNKPSGWGRDLPGWPLPKSLCFVPELYGASLSYGRNLLTGEESPAGQWLVRNKVAWVRPNPPVGALGDKVRPGWSMGVWACTSPRRWFDLDAVRTANPRVDERPGRAGPTGYDDPAPKNPAGAPPLDWWKIPPGGYSGKVSSTRRERVPVEHASACGAERTTSPDCPVHADLPGQLPKALRGERVAAQSLHTQRSGDRPAPAQEVGSAPTAPSSDRSGSAEPPTLATLPLPGSPTATGRNTASSRTGLAPDSTSPGIASGRSSGRTADTPETPRSGEPRPGMPGSSISASGSDEVPPSQPDHTADTETASSGSACTCSYWRTVTESTSHYAVFPPELCRIPIEASCPRRVCRTCGEPSRREVDISRVGEETGPSPWDAVSKTGGPWTSGLATNHTTTGWSSCGCPGTDGIRLDGYHTGTGWRPGVVLDPFAGSGTTLMVATSRSREAIGLDLDERNAELATDRVGPMFLTVEHLSDEGAA